MEIKRKPFQGITNIVKFNWHFYVIAIAFCIVLMFLSEEIPDSFSIYTALILCTISLTMVISLLTSFYVYDYSSFYEFKWIKSSEKQETILNINAGFDETSMVLNKRFPKSNLIIADFYNPKRHTEVSIKRARKAYPPVEGTIKINTSELPFPSNSVDKVYLTLAAHEIRNYNERVLFFKDIKRITTEDGIIYVTEHLRDVPNFLAYNIGFLHFYPRSNWIKTFEEAGLKLESELKNTPFISTFKLINNGSSF